MRILSPSLPLVRSKWTRGRKLDFEDKTTYMVTVKAEDSFGESATIMVTIMVTPVGRTAGDHGPSHCGIPRERHGSGGDVHGGGP